MRAALWLWACLAVVRPGGEARTSRERRPNIVLIMTDDQDVELGSLNYMPRVLRLVRDAGAEFRHAYTTTPMCCPSRSSMLTGMYVHNHMVFTNNDNCSSARWQATHETRSFATYLSNAGYRTGYFGKYLNKYNGSHIPPGWREWGGLIMNSRYYNYSVNLNGKRIRHGDQYHKDYYPDLIANDSISFLRQSRQYFSRKPVMLVLGFPAPHGPEDAAPQYSNLFFNVTSHHTPTYDYAPNPDKQWILRVTGQMRPIHRQFTDLLMTRRLQTLQSVDLAVQRVVDELRALGELDNTYIIYTSDHGYHLGQFGLVKGKSFPFEFDVRVPFLVRGPGIDPGTIVDEVVLNIDLAPTFLEIAGVVPPHHMDGRSFLRLVDRRRKPRPLHPWPDTFLIESSGRREGGSGFQEEPSQLGPAVVRLHHNSSQTTSPAPAHTTPSRVSDEKEDEEEEEEVEEDEDGDEEDGGGGGSGTASLPLEEGEEGEEGMVDSQSNSVGVSEVSKADRLEAECRRPALQLPCRPTQRWYCTSANNRWRKHKCKAGPGGTKCACFTPDGKLYTKIQPAGLHPHQRGAASREQSGGRLRLVREATSRRHNHVTSQLTSQLEKHRVRLEASLTRLRHLLNSTHVEPAVDALAAQLRLPRHASSLLEERVGEGCAVGRGGLVQCTQQVYRDPRAWKHSKHLLETQIKRLKLRLDKLKEIRKHLKEKRPVVGYDDSVEEEESEAETTTSGGAYTSSSLSTSQPPTTPPIRSTYLGRGKGEMGVPPRREEGSLRPPLPPLAPADNCYCPHHRGWREEGRSKAERAWRRQRKIRRKSRLEAECLAERMNCFNHDNHHWKTPPFWNEGPFCFCMNANNNTYSCLRTINATHNFLYCEFITGLVTFYNLRIDPFEQWNRVELLTVGERSFLHGQLAQLKACRGVKQCSLSTHEGTVSPRHHLPPPPEAPGRGGGTGDPVGVEVPPLDVPTLYRSHSHWRPWRRRHARNQLKPKKKHLLEHAREATIMKE